jgi:hypothetical protein
MEGVGGKAFWGGLESNCNTYKMLRKCHIESQTNNLTYEVPHKLSQKFTSNYCFKPLNHVHFYTLGVRNSFFTLRKPCTKKIRNTVREQRFRGRTWSLLTTFFRFFLPHLTANSDTNFISNSNVNQCYHLVILHFCVNNSKPSVTHMYHLLILHFTHKVYLLVS